jgi:hypothetical protein
MRNWGGIGSSVVMLAALSQCSPAQINAAATLNCALAADGATVVGIAKPGQAVVAGAAASVGCAAGQQVGQALATAPQPPVTAAQAKANGG